MKMNKYYLDEFMKPYMSIDDIGEAILDLFFKIDYNTTEFFHHDSERGHSLSSYKYFLLGLKDNPALDIYFDYFETEVTNKDKVYEDLNLTDHDELVEIRIIPNVDIMLNGNKSKSTNSYKTASCLAVFHKGIFSRVVPSYKIEDIDFNYIDSGEVVEVG